MHIGQVSNSETESDIKKTHQLQQISQIQNRLLSQTQVFGTNQRTRNEIKFQVSGMKMTLSIAFIFVHILQIDINVK